MNLDLRRLGLARGPAANNMASESISVKDPLSPLHSARHRVNMQTAPDNSLINIVTTDESNIDVARMHNSLRKLIQSTSSAGGGLNTPSLGGEQKQLKAINEIKRQFDDRIMAYDMQI
jgi:hypothetical protein